MPAYELQPVDTLFFRDGRPMDAGGHGATWPLPTVTHEALRAALLRAANTAPTRKSVVHHKKSSTGAIREKYVASDLFRSLRTIGPFPIRDGQLHFPRPSDVVSAGPADTDAGAKQPVVCLAPINQQSLPHGARTNLPTDWLSPVSSQAPPSKAKLPQWVTADWLSQYLGNPTTPPALPDYDKTLYDTEHRIGIEIDASTNSTKEGKFYTTEHLRLREGTQLWFDAQLNNADAKHPGGMAILKQLPDTNITLGGESRMCRILSGQPHDLKQTIPPPDININAKEYLIKWTLVTPAVFNNGWRPNWIDEKSGAVLLKKGVIDRADGETRLAWRERVRRSPTINAHLKAVCMPKPIFFSGWDVNLENNGKITGGPKPTVMAAASGTVFYFACDAMEDARALVQALHGRTQSDCFGEKGLGLGFCGNWQYLY